MSTSPGFIARAMRASHLILVPASIAGFLALTLWRFALAPMWGKAILAAIFAALAVAGHSRPKCALFALLATLPLFNSGIFLPFTGYYSPPVLALMAVVAGWCVGRLHGLHDDIRETRAWESAILAFVCIGTLSAAISIARYLRFAPGEAGTFLDAQVNAYAETGKDAIRSIMHSWIVFVAGPLAFWFTSRVVRTRTDVETGALALAGGMAASAAFGIAQRLFQSTAGNTEHFIHLDQINATFLDPNALGAFYIIGLAGIVGAAFAHAKITTRVALFGAAILCFAALLLSGSRTGVVGALLAGVIAAGLGVAARRKNSDQESHTRARVLAVVAVGAAMLLLTGWLLRDSSAAGRFASSLQLARSEGVMAIFASGRGELWRRALEAGLQFPISGIGLGTYLIEIPNLLGWRLDSLGYRDNAGNFYLQLFAEMGLIGLFVGLTGLVFAIDSATRGAIASGSLVARSLAAGVLALSLMLFTGPHTHAGEVALLLWGMLGALDALSPIREERPMPRALAAMLGAAVLLHGAVLLKDSRDELAVENVQQRVGFGSSAGFYEFEPGIDGGWGRWTRSEAYVMVPRSAITARARLMVLLPESTSETSEVRVDLDGVEVAKFLFKTSGQQEPLEVKLPPTGPPFAKMRLRVSRLFVAANDVPGATDTRAVGVFLENLTLENEP